MKAGRKYHDDLMQDLKDPHEAAAYLNAALEEGDRKAFLLALRHVLEAKGSMSQFANRTKINRVSLYKMLSDKGNPEFESLMTVLNALGVQFKILPKGKSSTRKLAA